MDRLDKGNLDVVNTEAREDRHYTGVCLGRALKAITTPDLMKLNNYINNFKLCISEHFISRASKNGEG